MAVVYLLHRSAAKTATARATYDFVYLLKNYGGKLNHLRDAEFMNKNNYSVEF